MQKLYKVIQIACCVFLGALLGTLAMEEFSKPPKPRNLAEWERIQKDIADWKPLTTLPEDIEAEQELQAWHAALTRFLDRHGRFPEGSPLDPESEFRREMRLNADQVRPPGVREYFYNLKFKSPRPDGTSMPTSSRPPGKELWIAQAARRSPGFHKHHYLLWSTGEFEKRSSEGMRALLVDAVLHNGKTTKEVVVVWPDEGGLPLGKRYRLGQVPKEYLKDRGVILGRRGELK